MEADVQDLPVLLVTQEPLPIVPGAALRSQIWQVVVLSVGFNLSCDVDLGSQQVQNEAEHVFLII